MNQRQQNSVNMYEAVIALFDKSSTVWNTKIPVLNAFNTFRTLADELSDTALSQQQEDTKGYTTQKYQQKRVLIDLAYSLSLKLKGYAKAVNHSVLLQAVGYSMSELDGSREQDMINRCQTIHDKGVEFKNIAVDYNILTEELAALQTAINTFKPLGIVRDSIGDNRTIATQDIGKLLQEGAKLLNILDAQVMGLIQDKAFLASYPASPQNYRPCRPWKS